MTLLERESACHELDQALQSVVDGAGQIALISGEAGIGKTSLITQFVRERSSVAPGLWGACDNLFTPRPLGPLHDIAPHTRGELSALLAANADRSAIFTAVLSALQTGPIIVVFEDVHWADEATLDLIRFLGRRIARTRALLVLTYRDDELDLRHPLRSVLGDLAGATATHRILLPALSEKAVGALVGDRALDAAALHQRTGGNPFFVTEVLADGGAIPSSIRDVVLARVARLSASAQAVLQAAAVIGPRIEPWILADVTGSESRYVDDSLALGMLVAQDHMLVFRHELARQTVLESISPPHRLALHRMTLAALTRSPTAQDDLACLAHHAEAANDGAAVLNYAPAAARQAAAVGAHRAAVVLYRLALRYAHDLPPATHANLLEAYALHASRIDCRAEAVAARRKAIELWRDVGDRLKQGENHAALVIMLIGMGRNAEAEQASQSAIALFETQPSPIHLASGYETQAALRLFNSDYDDTVAWCGKILTLDGVAKHTIVGRRVQMRLACADMVVDYERGAAALEHLLHTAYSAGSDDPQGEVDTANLLTNLGWRSALLYQFNRAERYTGEGLRYIADRDLAIFRNIMLAARALTALYLGDWNMAETLAGEVLHQPGASTISRITALEALARLHMRRGDSDVLATLDEALVLADQTGNIQRIGPIRAARAEAAWLGGDSERTLIEARAAYDRAVSKREPWISGELALWHSRAGDQVTPPECTARPFVLQIAGDWRAAAVEWARLGCPYEQARALADGDAAAQLAALAMFEWLGAQPAANQLRRTMRAAGVLRIPRGPRSSTRENPFGLTARQMDILGLLAEGLSNSQIAAQLYISPKTVDHHVCAVLARLDVYSREAAAAVARQHAIVS